MLGTRFTKHVHNTCSHFNLYKMNLHGLRLLPTSEGVLREKNRTCASFNKSPTKYISVESLINVLYEKITIIAIFSIGDCQEAGRRETT